MYVYTINEGIQPGLPIRRDLGGKQRPFIPAVPGCPPLLLDNNIVEAVMAEPREGGIWYGAWYERGEFTPLNMAVEIAEQHILLHGRPGRDRMALLQLTVAPGIGGKVTLTSSDMTSGVVKQQVARTYKPFPDAGVQLLGHPGAAEGYNAGVDFIDTLLLLYPGASFRVARTGKLSDDSGWKAPAVLFVAWTGSKLKLTAPNPRVTRQDVRGFAGAAV